MSMDEWMVIVVAVIAIAGCVKTGVLILRNQKNAVPLFGSRNRALIYPGSSVRSATETGPMVYYANNNHGRRDNEYRFNYKKVNGSWRAYILRMPGLGKRPSDGIVTHRLWDGPRPYVCWDRPVNSLSDMQTISRVWADNIQVYIATGKRFG